MTHEEKVGIMFERVCQVLQIKDLKCKPMRGRMAPVNTAKNFSLGYIDLAKKIITVDIYTPKKRRPKSLKSILGVIAHEIAHLQKPPHRQYYKGKWIWRQHYPQFYRQANKNFKKLLKDITIQKLIASDKSL